MADILIVEARFYAHLNDMLIAGARAALEAVGHEVEVLTVPGALEIPGAIALAAEAVGPARVTANTKPAVYAAAGSVDGVAHGYLVIFRIICPKFC